MHNPQPERHDSIKWTTFGLRIDIKILERCLYMTHFYYIPDLILINSEIIEHSRDFFLFTQLQFN